MSSFIVVGLTFGDEGKGSVTDYLVRTCGAKTVVRFNGGPQAGHNVVTPDGRWHCFAQIGAGSFVEGVETILGPEMLVELENLEVEAQELDKKRVESVLKRVVIDLECAVITPMHKMICQMKEVAAGPGRKGSCGMGVGEAARDRSVTLRRLISPDAGGAQELASLASRCFEEAAELRRLHSSSEMEKLFEYFSKRCDPDALFSRYRAILSGLRVTSSAESMLSDALDRGPVVFEGAQGALLDGTRGFVPFVTESRTSFHGAARMLQSGALFRKIGVLRAYGHRHGPGPFVTERPELTAHLFDPYNRENRWQGAFRVGDLDLVAVGYGLMLNGGVDGLAVTGLDRLSGLPAVRICTSYQYEGPLADLDPMFLYERTGERSALIRSFAAPAGLRDPGLARVLSRCRPLDFVELPGWSADLRGVRAVASLPSEARKFLEVIETSLNTPIAIVSVAPAASGKIALASSEIVRNSDA